MYYAPQARKGQTMQIETRFSIGQQVEITCFKTPIRGYVSGFSYDEHGPVQVVVRHLLLDGKTEETYFFENYVKVCTPDAG